MPLDRDLTEFTTAGPTNTIFNWEDVIASVGYKTFFTLRNTEGDLLVTSNPISNNFWTTRNSSGTTEINFDHEFLAAVDIEGQGFFEFTGKTVSDGTGAIETLIGKIRLIHVDSDNNETEITAEISSDTLGAPATTVYKRMGMTLNIPNTHFAVGEKLRLEFKMVTVEDTTGTFVIWHDAANRGAPGGNDVATGEPPGTDMQLTIPFRIPI